MSAFLPRQLPPPLNGGKLIALTERYRGGFGQGRRIQAGRYGIGDGDANHPVAN